MSAAAIFDLLLDKLEMKLSQEVLLELADWIAKLIVASYREGREDGLWEAEMACARSRRRPSSPRLLQPRP